MTLLHLTLRTLLALVFLTAASVKLMDMSLFTQSVSEFGLVPDQLTLTTAWLVVLSELAVGFSLALNVRWSLIGAFGLLGLFIGVLIYGIALGLDIQCGCFGPGYHVSLKTQLFIDIGLVMLAITVCWSGIRCATKRSLPLKNDPA